MKCCIVPVSLNMFSKALLLGLFSYKAVHSFLGIGVDSRQGKEYTSPIVFLTYNIAVKHLFFSR